jgi:hypothetical protein
MFETVLNPRCSQRRSFSALISIDRNPLTLGKHRITRSTTSGGNQSHLQPSYESGTRILSCRAERLHAAISWFRKRRGVFSKGKTETSQLVLCFRKYVP